MPCNLNVFTQNFYGSFWTCYIYSTRIQNLGSPNLGLIMYREMLIMNSKISLPGSQCAPNYLIFNHEGGEPLSLLPNRLEHLNCFKQDSHIIMLET